ncbi:MAG TPA: carboxylesterase family protein, partial [Phenylobacterium sp.]
MEAGQLEAVQTSGGRVEGVRREGHLAFFGIPYAACPTGELRFRPPQRAKPWTGVRRTHEIG